MNSTPPPRLSEAFPNNDDNDLDSNSLGSSVHSNDSNVAVILGSPSSRMSLDSLSVGSSNPAPKNPFPTLINDDETSENEELPIKYRNSGPDLITLHMRTGLTKGNREMYVPVYKRNKAGVLRKLTRTLSGRWKYVRPKELLVEEIDAGLRIFEEPEVEVVSQRSKPEEAVERPTLGGFGLP